jgi:phytoene synthase
MINRTIFSIFKEGSKTYFYSSIFFPTYIKKDVFTLYGFVRKADNYVDSIPQNINGFYEFKNKYYRAINGKKTDDIVINLFANLVRKKDFNPKWVEAFFKSMEMDITKSTYSTMNETLEYIHGSAEVIGLMMGKIMNLSEESFNCAKYLGRAMQYINFIRDIAEDVKLNRVYFPQTDLKKFGIEKLDYEYILNNPEKYNEFIKRQLFYYCNWQSMAEEGYKYIPKRYLIPVKTASEMYNWTAEQIFKDPMIVYVKKVKPQVSKIVSTTIMNVIDPKSPKRRRTLPYIIKNTQPKLEYYYQKK